MKSRELFVVQSVLFVLCGYMLGMLLIPLLGNEWEMSDAFLTQLDHPTMAFFFWHNIRYFLIISILPFINAILVPVQLGLTGIQLVTIRSLSFSLQFMLMYRHLFFEWLALIIAMFISYRWVDWFKLLHARDYSLARREFVKLGIMYLLVLVFTAIGAYLEGGWHA